MKIETTFDPKTSRLVIRYDSEIQEMFYAAACTISKFFDVETYVRVTRDLDDDRNRDLANGGRLLLELIRTESRTVETDAEKAHWTLDLLSWSTLHMVEAGQPTVGLESALIVFANSSSIRVPSFRLPPPNEALNRETTPSEIREMYENLRALRKPEDAFLSVAQAYELCRELRKTRPPLSSLTNLIDFLEASSRVYQVALDALAAAHKAPKHHLKERK